MAVTSTPSFSSFYSPANPIDQTVLTGSSFDTKIGYKFRSAAQQELYVILQDVEGTPLTDSAGEPLVALIDGFVTSELTSEKALGIVLPTVPESQQVLDFTLFGDEFDVRRRQVGAGVGGGDIPPYVEITNPQGGWKYIGVKDTIEIATGADIVINSVIDGREFERFIIDQISLDNSKVHWKFNDLYDTQLTLQSPINKSATLKELHVKNIRTYFNSMSEMFVPTSLWEQTKNEPLEIFSAVDASFI